MTSEPEQETVPPASPSQGARLVAARLDAMGLRRVHVEPDAPFAFIPGQVAALSIPGGERGLFAIASAPHEPGPLTFLIRDGGSASSRTLLDAEPGAALILDGPLGAGFDLGGTADADVLLVGAGTGVAPLRSVLAELLATPARTGRLALVQGIRRPEHLCFADEQGRWRAAGVLVRVVISGPAPSDRWVGPVGHVQSHLTDLVTPSTIAFLAGMGAMVDETRATLVQLGLDPARVRTNLG